MDEGWVADGHRLRWRLDRGYVLDVVPGGDDPDALASPCEFGLEGVGGTRWSGTAATPAHLAELLGRWATTGEHGGGVFVAMRDLVVVPRPTVDAVRDAVVAIIAEGTVETDLVRLAADGGADQLEVVFTTWPDEEQLLAELWLGDVYIGHVRQRPDGLVTDLYAAEGIPLADLEDALAAIRERLGG